MPSDEPGHEGELVWRDPAALPLTIDGEEVWRCPRRPLKDAPAYWAELMDAYDLFKRGHLPDPGHVSEQSARGLTLLRLTDQMVESCRQERIERERTRAARGAS